MSTSFDWHSCKVKYDILQQLAKSQEWQQQQQQNGLQGCMVHHCLGTCEQLPSDIMYKTL